MPTTLPRTMITHTPPIERALDAARQRWPDEKPSTLLHNLIAEGEAKIAEDRDAEIERRLAALAEVSGKYNGIWGPGYLDEIREGWSE